MTTAPPDSTAADKLYEARSFGEFWEHYQELHANPRTRAAHAVATASALGLAALAYSRRSWKLALLAPAVDYAIAQLSHRRFDGTRTHPTRKPLWHARAEWRLFRQTIRDAEHQVYRRM
jgi:hypothetical protein